MARRHRVLLLAALFVLAQILAVTWTFQRQPDAAGSYLEKGTMLLGKAKVTVVAAASTVFAACAGLIGSVRAGDKEWLEKCPTPESRKAARELNLVSASVGTGDLHEGPNVHIPREGGADVKAGPVELGVAITTSKGRVEGTLFGDIRIGSDGASLRFTSFKMYEGSEAKGQPPSGREFPVCAFAFEWGYPNDPGIPKVEDPDPEPRPGFMAVTTGRLGVHFAY